MRRRVARRLNSVCAIFSLFAPQSPCNSTSNALIAHLFQVIYSHRSPLRTRHALTSDDSCDGLAVGQSSDSYNLSYAALSASSSFTSSLSLSVSVLATSSDCPRATGVLYNPFHSLPGPHKLAPQLPSNSLDLEPSTSANLSSAAPTAAPLDDLLSGWTCIAHDIGYSRARRHSRATYSPTPRNPAKFTRSGTNPPRPQLQRLRSNASLSLPALQTGSAFRRPHQTGSPRGRQIYSVVYDPTLPFARLRLSQSPSSGMPVPATQPPSFYDTALAASDARQLSKKRKKVDVLRSRVAASKPQYFSILFLARTVQNYQSLVHTPPSSSHLRCLNCSQAADISLYSALCVSR
ncbi:hypothetical protein DFH09DRAFT_1312501 [Mycena vulgaris]|nr:hypothetical protein DFH09DRAFT_1312501 [Mycena vulgaris]